MSVNINGSYGVGGAVQGGAPAHGVAIGLEQNSNPVPSIHTPNGKGVHRLALVPAKSIRIGSQFREFLGDLNSVASSIDTGGLLQPPVVMVSNSEVDQEPWYDLVAGFRRLKAMTELLKWDTVPVLVATGIDPMDAKMAENVVRLDPTASERVKAGLEYETLYSRKTGRPEKDSDDPDKGKTTNELIAKRIGLGSEETYRKAKKVYQSGLADLIKLMDSGPRKIDAAYSKLKAKEAKQKATEAGTKTEEPTDGQNADTTDSESTTVSEEPKPGDALKVRPFTQAMVDIQKCLQEHGAFELKPKVIDGALFLPAKNTRLALIVAAFKVENLAKLIEGGTLTLKIK